MEMEMEGKLRFLRFGFDSGKGKVGLAGIIL